MSIVMYAFKAKDRENLERQIKLARSLSQDFPDFYKKEGIEFQIFEVKSGIIYRVLENGYGLQNKMWKDPSNFITCNYDDRTEIEPEDELNKSITNEMDTLIKNKQFEITRIC